MACESYLATADEEQRVESPAPAQSRADSSRLCGRWVLKRAVMDLADLNITWCAQIRRHRVLLADRNNESTTEFAECTE